jgi:ligand-binding sensor domain-containing protein
VIALSSNRNTPVRITSTGTQTTLSGLPANTVASGTAPRLDARGLLWMSSMEWGVGAAQTQVFAWDPVSGAVSFRQPEVTSSGNPTLLLSPDGRTLLIFPYNSYGTSIQKVDTATGQSAALDAVTSVGSSSVAFAGDGTIWFGSYSGLSRLNADGTLTTFQNSPYVDTVYGFDRQAPSVLWASGSNGVQRIDVSTMKAQSIPVSGPRVGYLAAQGGLKLITYEYGYGNSTTQYYISLLK